MGLSKLSITLSIVVVLAFAKTEVALCHLVKGSVLCVDCDSPYDYSGGRRTQPFNHWRLFSVIPQLSIPVPLLSMGTHSSKTQANYNATDNKPKKRRRKTACLSPCFGFSIKVLIECDRWKTRVVATSKNRGSFEVEARNISAASNCQARLLGGPKQLYASKRNTISKVSVAAADQSAIFTAIAATLTFASCSHFRKLGLNCSARNTEFGSSQTVDLPVPPEYGLAPTSYYFTPFVPIIGIP